MKKTIKLFIGLFMLASISAVSAQNYKHSIGVTFGTLNGASYKTFFSENLALKADLALYKYTVPGGGRAGWGWLGYIGTLELNPNLLYQKNISSWDWGNLDWYVGGGVSLGYAYWRVCGKFGVNASGGVELALSKIPLAFDFDFRPGYGMLFDAANTQHYFDWGLAWSVRYCFK